MLTHANLTAAVLSITVDLPFGAGTVWLAILPFFHVAGMVCLLHTAICAGGTLVLLRPFDTEVLRKSIQNYQIEVAELVPPIVALAKSPAVESYDLSSLKLITCGAAPLGAGIQRACEERLRTPVVQGYGMTGGMWYHPSQQLDPPHSKPGSVGYCAPNIQCKIVDPLSTDELGVKETGELWIRSPQVMKGYFNNPAATAESLDAEGWYHTGDLGYADEDGYFYIVDRLKELIKYKGYQVIPSELEAILLNNPAIVEGAVIPIPDEQAGEVPKAFVVTRRPLTA
jgi:acyl-CoA synthetase (AMP-forming)/AMP-acid ligase II